MVKRTFDAVVASVGLVLSVPLIVVLAAAVKLTSPGPVFFRHPRVGLNRQPFHCYKLRTMVHDAVERLESDPELLDRHRRNGFKLPTHQDPRVTPLGRFLRRTHLDELPQLWNVLRGEMSLVGPRPIVEEELLHYGERSRELLVLRPGIFGPWTAQGPDRVDYPDRVQVELSYRRRASIQEDFWILLRHLPVLLTGQKDEAAVADEGANGERSVFPAHVRGVVRRSTANRWISGLSLLAGDVVVALGAVHAAAGVRTALWGSIGIPWGFYGAVLAWVGLRGASGLYSNAGMPGPEELRRGTITTAVAAILHGAILFAAEAATSSRFVAFGAWALLIPLSWVVRSAVKAALIRTGSWGVPVIVVGAGKTGSRVVQELEGDRSLGLRPVGVFDDDPTRANGNLKGVPFLGPLEVALNGEVSRGVRHVILAMPEVEPERLEAIVDRLRVKYRRVGVVPGAYGGANLWARTAPVGPYLSVELRNNLLRRGNLRLKRTFDLVLGIPLLVLSIPIIAGAVLAVRLVDRGPLFFSQEREGHRGRRFRMWKIRTMVTGAEERLEEHLARHPEARAEWAERMKLRCDPRIVPAVGRLLRRFSIDELPQLWNVVRGEMSLVGPRPFPEYHLEGFPPDFRRLRRDVPPGVTGYWQVTTRSNGGLDKQQVADSYYIHNWSLWLDLWILHRTVGAVLSGEGAT